MRTRRLLPLGTLLFGLLALPTLLLADEQPTATAPAPAPTSYAARAKAFPEPSMMLGFAFRGRVKLEGLDLGIMSLKAEAAEQNGIPVWKVAQRLEMLGGSHVLKLKATLDRQLRALAGRARSQQPEESPVEVIWHATEEGWHVEHAVKSGEKAGVSVTQVSHEGPVTTTMAAFCLITRFVLPETGRFDVTVLNADGSAEKPPFETAEWTVTTDAQWAGRTVWAGKGRKGTGDTLEVFLEPKTENLLGLRITTADERVMEVRAIAPDEDWDDDFFDRPAKSAEEAALQGALAFATGDLKLLERITHWPTVHALAQAAHDVKYAGQPDVKPFPDSDGYRDLLLVKLEEKLTKRPRAMIETVLKGALVHLDVENLDDGRVRVTFPPIFKNLKLIVRQVKRVWYLAGMPEQS